MPHLPTGFADQRAGKIDKMSNYPDANGTGMAIFDTNKKKDIAEIQRHIDAFKTVLKYYGEGNE